MSQILLQPAGPGEPARHFRDTIETLVPLSRMEPFIGSDPAFSILEARGLSAVAVWGITPGQSDRKRKIWERLEPGTVAAFTGAGHLYATGIILATAHSADLAQELWGRDKAGQTWEYIYFLDDVRGHALPYLEMNRVAGYNENFTPQGSMLLRPEKAQPLLDALAIEPIILSKQVAKPDLPSVGDELDRAAVTKTRTEQSKLRNYLLSLGDAPECILCGRVLPPELLVAAHIKKRASCSDDERRDFENVAALICHFGCDRLFENGFVTIGSDGCLEVSPRLEAAALKEPALGSDVERLRGRKTPWWTAERDAYCRWHRDNVFQHPAKV